MYTYCYVSMGRTSFRALTGTSQFNLTLGGNTTTPCKVSFPIQGLLKIKGTHRPGALQ